MAEEGWSNKKRVAHGEHPDWPGEWASVWEILNGTGELVGYEVQWKLYRTLHDVENAGWKLMFHYYDDGKEIYRKEEEKLAKNKFWTKCGREFTKSTDASVTGYTIDENDKECADCPFQVEVTQGWPEKKHVRWECRAGSKPPNHKNEWVGSLEDKNTIQIRSLDNDFLEAVMEYCKSQPDLSAGYNQDLDDCRRVISVSCSQNKKGIAAKKELIEKFFPETEAVPDEKYEDEEQGCCDIYDCPFNDLGGACCFADEDPNSDGYQQDVIAAVKECGCKNEDVLLTYRIIENPDSFDLPADKDEQRCRVCGCTDSNACPEGCYWVEDDLCSRCAEMEGNSLEEKEENQVIYPDKKVSVENTDLEAHVSNSIQAFDYSTVDEETAAFLQEKAVNIAQVNAISLAAIGKELKEAQDKLAKKGYGCFQEWCQSLGVSKSSAYNYINVYNLFIQRVGQTEYLEKAPAKLLYEISKPSAKPELVEAVVSGDITTHKQYKELEEKLRKAEEALERQRENNKNIYEAMERKDSEVIKYRKQAQEAEGKLNIREIEIQKLRQQLDQAKRNADPQKIQELGEIIREKQQEIEELRKQLKDKPIEVPAVKIVEKVPEKSKYEVINRTYGTLLAAKLISKSDIEICREADFTRKNSIIEFLENLRDAIPEYLNILNEEVQQHKCEDCRFCDWEDLKEEDEAAGMIYCTLNEDKQLWYNNRACENFEEL